MGFRILAHCASSSVFDLISRKLSTERPKRGVLILSYVAPKGEQIPDDLSDFISLAALLKRSTECRGEQGIGLHLHRPVDLFLRVLERCSSLSRCYVGGLLSGPIGRIGLLVGGIGTGKRVFRRRNPLDAWVDVRRHRLVAGVITLIELTLDRLGSLLAHLSTLG